MPIDESPRPSRSEAGRREIARQIDLLADALARVPGVGSVILMGSAARDELAWIELDGRPQLFSDLEFLAVTETRLPPARRREAEASLKRIAAGFGHRSALFHVDVLFKERDRLPKMPPIVFTFELARLGRPLRGRHDKTALPTVTAGNLDRHNTREILMKRLWAMAAGVPAAALTGRRLDPIEARSLGVALWRNPLDVPTVLLACTGILEGGYERRQRIWAQHPELPFRRLLDQRLGRDSAVYLRDCIALRRDCASAEPVRAAHRDATTLVVGALDWLSRLGDGAEARDARRHEVEGLVDALHGGPARAATTSAPAADPRVAAASERKALDDAWLADVAARVAASDGRLFNARPISRGEWWAWLAQGVRFAYRRGPRAALRWWAGPRKAQLCAALIHLHRALPAVWDDDLKAARPALDAAMWACASVIPLEPGPLTAYREAAARGDAAAAWLAVRQQVGRLFWHAVRLGQPAAWGAMAAAIDAAEPSSA